jgi:biotin transporter BioY
MQEFTQELESLRERNLRVEADKAWETSTFRKLLIATITYIVASVVLYVIGVQNFYFGAIVPTLGFFLSTLTLPFIKQRWIKNYRGRISASKSEL